MKKKALLTVLACICSILWLSAHPCLAQENYSALKNHLMPILYEIGQES